MPDDDISATASKKDNKLTRDVGKKINIPFSRGICTGTPLVVSISE